jgi:hypothetical protein
MLVGLRLALIAALALPLVNPAWDQYDDKGMHWRVLVFPFAGLVVPVLWGVAGSRPPYPYLADALVLAVPLTDVLWNTFDAYDRVWWWDDLNHLLNSAVIAYVIGLWVRRYPMGPVVRFALVLGVGMTLAVAWELAEYPTFLNTSAELATAYRDTLGDLGLALLGSSCAALVAARRLVLDGADGEPEPVFVLADR